MGLPQARYGVAYAFEVPVIKAGTDGDFAATADWTPAAGDVKVSKDGGAFSNITTLPTALGNHWAFSLSATEMEAKRVVVQVVDSATKAVKDQSILIDTLPSGAITTGKCQGGSTTTAQLAAGEDFTTDNIVNGVIFEAHGGTGRGQSAGINGYTNSTDTASLDSTLTTAIASTTYYTLWPAPKVSSTPPSVSVTHWSGSAVGTPDTAGYPKVTVKSGTGTGEMSLSSGRVALQTPPYQKNTAISAFMFQMFDATTKAPATGKTVTVTRNVDGGAFGAGALGSVTEVSSGWYKVAFAAGDTNGTVIGFRATATGCDDTNMSFFTFA